MPKAPMIKISGISKAVDGPGRWLETDW